MDLPLSNHCRRLDALTAVPNTEITGDIFVKRAMAVTREAQYDLDSG